MTASAGLRGADALTTFVAAPADRTEALTLSRREGFVVRVAFFRGVRPFSVLGAFRFGALDVAFGTPAAAFDTLGAPRTPRFAVTVEARAFGFPVVAAADRI